MPVRVAIILTTAVLLAGCADDEPPDTSDAATSHAVAAHGLTATLLQYREDEVRHELSIKVRNSGTEPVRIMDLRLLWDGLEPVDRVGQDHLLGVGQALDLRVPFGDGRCANDYSLDPPSTTSATGDATIELADGSTEAVQIPIDDVEDQLGRLYRTDCRRQFVASVVSLELTGPWERVDPGGEATLRGALAVERRARDRTITILDVDGSVLLNVRPTEPIDEPLLVLGPDDDAGTVPIDVTPARCDAHALGESKKTYVFQLQVDLGDGPEGVVISPDTATESVMYQVILDGCGL
ncbi:MAG: hypothetical protein AB7Q42_15280 [Acidimicrobiia bacterium]